MSINKYGEPCCDLCGTVGSHFCAGQKDLSSPTHYTKEPRTPTPVADEVELPAEAFRFLELEVENKETIERIKVKIKALIDEKEALKAENAKLKDRIQELERELKEESKASAIEKSWQERQGEDYGSY